VTLTRFTSLPSGTYRVRAVLKGLSGREFAETGTRINVVNEDGY
jgi:hypothetical protein